MRVKCLNWQLSFTLQGWLLACLWCGLSAKRAEGNVERNMICNKTKEKRSNVLMHTYVRVC